MLNSVIPTVDNGCIANITGQFGKVLYANIVEKKDVLLYQNTMSIIEDVNRKTHEDLLGSSSDTNLLNLDINKGIFRGGLCQ